MSFVIVNQTQGNTDSSLKASLPFLFDTPEMGKSEESLGEVASMEAAAVVVVVAVVFLHLIVVNWSGDEIARLEVRPSDLVLVGMRQVEEQLGVPVARQMLVCYEDLLDAGQVWSSYSSVRDWSTIQLTTVGQTFDAASDREALMVLFESCGGSAWTYKNNWGSAEPLSSWEGLEVDETGRVTRLNLGDVGMSGVVPDAIGNLTALERLDLSENHLIGCIPTQLIQLTALSDLALAYNGFTGGIPPEMGYMTTLKKLLLSDNQLTGVFPPELCLLTALCDLDLSLNHLAGAIPHEIGQLTSLVYLDLTFNRLCDAIPPEIGNLCALQSLDLTSNLLTGGIPPELGNLTNLWSLHLDDNQLTSIPRELSNLTELLELRLGRNLLAGDIPRTLSRRSAIEDFFLTQTYK